MMYQLFITVAISYAIYRVSKFFLVSWQNETGYALLIACLSLAWFYGSFPLWGTIAIGIGSFVALYLLLSRVCRFYIRKPIVTHLSMIAIVFSVRVIPWSTVIDSVMDTAQKVM